MRSYAELLEASGYGSRPKDFDDLIRSVALLEAHVCRLNQGHELLGGLVARRQPGQVLSALVDSWNGKADLRFDDDVKVAWEMDLDVGDPFA